MARAKILIIEDDPLISQMYQDIFAFEDYTIIIANDGEDGLQKVKSESPTLILCDIMMPKMNGLEVLDSLKSDSTTAKIPVVMLTNLAGSEDAKVALTKGAVKYIVKSNYTPKEVTDMVKEILSGYTRDQIPTQNG
jgi:CheY-like chemotaxis protein